MSKSSSVAGFVTEEGAESVHEETATGASTTSKA
jgi:hypothetical protein